MTCCLMSLSHYLNLFQDFFKIQDCLLLYICLQAYTYKAHCDIMKIISIMQS